MLNIGGLHEGVVIDHIKAGGAMKIYKYLTLLFIKYLQNMG